MSETYPAFLESEFPPAARGQARFHVLPAPLEATVSWKGGARNAPRAILEASQQLEAWDRGREPGAAGIWTAPAPVCGPSPLEAGLDAVRRAVSESLAAGAVPVVLGGEHTVAAAAVQACCELRTTVGVVQFDAHADLRESYEGSAWSHACTARRLLDLGVPLLQIGVRSMSRSEMAIRSQQNIPAFDAAEIAEKGPAGVAARIPPGFPRDVWITFDVDAFDPSLIPATGTPEPGGIFWWDALKLIQAVCAGRRLIGFDVCELAPAPGFHHCDFTVARLVYALMAEALEASAHPD